MLIRMLNRLGACSSADTLARVIQYRVEEREKRGVEQDCNPNEITIISVDNIDFLHNYAQVYCGAQTSSWHGPTVQAVQPKPNTWYSDLTGPPPTKGTTTNMASPMQTMPEVSPIRELISISQGECASAIATYEIQNHSECLSDSPPNIAHKDGLTPLQQHTEWLHNIRQTMWDRIQFENEMVPSTDALHQHWKRSCWVLDLWNQAEKNILNPKLLTEYGWLKDGGIVWDSDTNIKEIMLRVTGLLKGCGCKTGCQTQRCGCKGKNKKCGEGCECRNCLNTPHSPQINRK